LSNLFGIDKIALFLPVSEVLFEPHFPATIENPVNAATGEPTSHQQLYFNGEQHMTGRKAHYNTPDFHFDVTPDRAGGPANCILHWSAGAFAESNEVPLDKERTAQVARDVEAALLAAGVRFPMEKARLVRVDLARNVELSYPVANYSPVFQALSTRKSVNKTDFGGTGFLAGNTQRQIAFYDKGAEMHAKGLDLAECPVNTLRPECRYLRGRVVRDSLGVDTVGELQSAWETLHPAYIHSLKRDVFRAKMEEKAEATLDFHREARYVMEGPSQRKFQAFKGDIGLLHMVERMGLEAAKHFTKCFLVEDGASASGKRQLKRIYAQLEQADYAIRMGDAAPDGTPLKELYRELKRVTLSK
jgi:hypothetical protein